MSETEDNPGESEHELALVSTSRSQEDIGPSQPINAKKEKGSCLEIFPINKAHTCD